MLPTWEDRRPPCPHSGDPRRLDELRVDEVLENQLLLREGVVLAAGQGLVDVQPAEFLLHSPHRLLTARGHVARELRSDDGEEEWRSCSIGYWL